MNITCVIIFQLRIYVLNHLLERPIYEMGRILLLDGLPNIWAGPLWSMNL